MSGECCKGVATFYETLIHPEYGSSYEATKASYMYSVKDEISNGTFFDWYKLHVCPDSHRGAHLTATNIVWYSRQQEKFIFFLSPDDTLLKLV